MDFECFLQIHAMVFYVFAFDKNVIHKNLHVFLICSLNIMVIQLER